MQGQDTLILNDGHSVSIVEALTTRTRERSGDGGQRHAAGELRLLQPLPRDAAAILGRLFDSFRVANYQYIPALATAVGQAAHVDAQHAAVVSKSEIGAGRGAAGRRAGAASAAARRQSEGHLLRAQKFARAARRRRAIGVLDRVCARHRSCASPARTAKRSTCRRRRMPRKAASSSTPRRSQTASLEDRFEGSLHGYWGFEKFDGPGFQLVNTHSQAWTPSSTDDGSLIVGRANTIHLQAGSVACIDRIMVKDPAGKELRVEWSPVKANEVRDQSAAAAGGARRADAARLAVRREGTASSRAARLSRGGTLREFLHSRGRIAGRSQRQPARAMSPVCR